MVPRVHNLDHHLHLLRRGTGQPGCRLERLEYVAGAHAVHPPAIDEDDLLGTGEHVEIPRGDHDALEPSLDPGGAYLARILERLERQRQMALVDATELHHHVRQHLPSLWLGDARHAYRHDDAPPAGDVAVHPHDQQRVAHVVRSVAGRLDGD